MKSRDRWFYPGVVGAFLVVWGAILCAIVSDLRPAPVYKDIKTDGILHHSVPNFEAGEPLTIEFEAPAADINGVYWMDLIALPFVKAELQIANLSTGPAPVDLGMPGGDRVSRFDGRGFNAAGDQIRISIRRLRETPPRLWMSEAPPAREVSLYIGEQLFSGVGSPLLYLGKKNPAKRSQPDPQLNLYPAEEMTGGKSLALKGGEPFRIITEAPADEIEYLILPRLLADEEQATVEATVRNLTRNTLLKQWRTRSGSDHARMLNGEGTKQGDEIEITLNWTESPPPRIQKAQEEPRVPLAVRDGELLSTNAPIFMVYYEWPSKSLFWIWMLVPVALLMVLRSERNLWEGVLVVVLALAAFVSGALAWQQNYTHQWMHMDPDRYGLYGEMLANWVRSPDKREGIETWIRHYPHAHVILTPVLVALGMLLGLGKSAAYLIVVGLATIATLSLAHFHLRRQMGLSKSLAVFGLLLFATHIFFLKAAGRPSSDALGLTSVVALFCALAARRTSGGWRNNLCLSLLLLFASFARPPGISYFLPVLSLVLGIDLFRDWKEQGLAIWKTTRSGFAIALPPLLVLAYFYWQFDWFHTQELSMEKSKEFYEFSTGPLFLRCLVPLLSVLPLAWLWFIRRTREYQRQRPLIAIYVGWLVFYSVMLWLVQAPFLTRLFIPVMPSVLFLTILGISRMTPKVQRAGYCAIALLGILGVVVMRYLIDLPFLPPTEISPFIY